MVLAFYKSKKAMVLYLIAAIVIYIFSLSPSFEGPWKPEYERLAHVDIQGRTLLVRNIRDKQYKSADKLEHAYIERSFHLDDLKQLWYGVSHFGAHGFAHSFLSFEFANDEFLVLSVEARLTPEQSYNPIVGALRQYNKIFVLSTERDVIGLRSHIRNEKVLLYPTSIGEKEKVEHFLLALLNEVNELYQEPAFYNTLLDNCLSNLLKHTSFHDEISALDLRVLLPGYSDKLSYELGITPNDISFEEARFRARVRPEVTSIDSEGYSKMIRCGWRGYKQGGQELQYPACPN